VIRRLRDYYRQFEELSQEEISAELRERRDAERASALTEVQALDLATPAWHEPPDAEAVNAATYALRRAVNAYPDDDALREALAGRHGVGAEHVAPGHGAGELLHAAFGARSPGSSTRRAERRCLSRSTPRGRPTSTRWPPSSRTRGRSSSAARTTRTARPPTRSSSLPGSPSTSG
jgi:hypothetical protein